MLASHLKYLFLNLEKSLHLPILSPLFCLPVASVRRIEFKSKNVGLLDRITDLVLVVTKIVR